VLVSELSMPGQDGRWLVAEARRLGVLTGVRALVVTAVAMLPSSGSSSLIDGVG
jgi:hypothetical protein